jgi:hypothetical protein
MSDFAQTLITAIAIGSLYALIALGYTTEEVPPNKFDYSSVTNDFAAVNAYYHCDRLFRIVSDLGFNVPTYFDGTLFPVRVDHRASFGSGPNIINAQAPGTANGRGSDGFRFALAKLNSNLGLASDWRVVLHEFGHAILWDHVHSPNFGFAHSAGDSLAAILNDPVNQADRGLTFPWVAHVIDRRHDRTPQSGWAWYGPRYEPFDPFGNDSAGYLAEQMLSSTMFRIYCAAGGDSQDVAIRQFAAHYVAFLILKATALLTPISNAQVPEDFADVLMQADTGTFTYEGASHQAGVLSKVIRWGFEVQGAYVSPTAPRPNLDRGLPPVVDVFIEDGRSGEYQFAFGPTQSPDIWIRQSPDGGTEHQQPTTSSTNHVYVRVMNRGNQSASNVELQVFQAPAGTSMWPTGWTPLSAATPPATIPTGGSIVLGPIPWVPVSQETVLLASVSSSGDMSNAARFSLARPVAFDRLVHCDNNLGYRVITAT